MVTYVQSLRDWGEVDPCIGIKKRVLDYYKQL